MIPVNTPLLNGNEEKYLVECVRTGWISSEGPFIKTFEDKFAAYVQRTHGIAVANGSAALDIAVQALSLEAGSEVILPAFTIISPAQSVVRAGLKPVLVDSDPQTWNMDVSRIEEKITAKTKAIIVVHIYGLPIDMDPVLELCRKYKLKLIEDAAEMHGQTYRGKSCGSFGTISIFSFIRINTLRPEKEECWFVMTLNCRNAVANFAILLLNRKEDDLCIMNWAGITE